MILKNLNQIFSNMDWLDEEIKIYKSSEGRNPRSDAYYNNLLTIKNKQQAGIIPFEEYKSLKRLKHLRTIEYGYYTANIHYDLFRYYKEQKEIIDDRIIFFLQNASNEIFDNEYSWFRLNFYLDYSYVLREYYQCEEKDYDLEYFVNKYGNAKEKEIARLLRKAFVKEE